MTDRSRIEGRIERGGIDASADAARSIAERIENEDGFWEERETMTDEQNPSTSTQRESKEISDRAKAMDDLAKAIAAATGKRN